MAVFCADTAVLAGSAGKQLDSGLGSPKCSETACSCASTDTDDAPAVCGPSQQPDYSSGLPSQSREACTQPDQCWDTRGANRSQQQLAPLHDAQPAFESEWTSFGDCQHDGLDDISFPTENLLPEDAFDSSDSQQPGMVPSSPPCYASSAESLAAPLDTSTCLPPGLDASACNSLDTSLPWSSSANFGPSPACSMPYGFPASSSFGCDMALGSPTSSLPLPDLHGQLSRRTCSGGVSAEERPSQLDLGKLLEDWALPASASEAPSDILPLEELLMSEGSMADDLAFSQPLLSAPAVSSPADAPPPLPTAGDRSACVSANAAAARSGEHTTQDSVRRRRIIYRPLAPNPVPRPAAAAVGSNGGPQPQASLSDGSSNEVPGSALAVQPRKRGRPRVYDTATPVLEAAAAGKQTSGQEPKGKKRRGAKPKYICSTEEEAVAKRRDRNRKTALATYYRRKARIAELQQEIGGLEAEGAALTTLLDIAEISEECAVFIRPKLDAGCSAVDVVNELLPFGIDGAASGELLEANAYLTAASN